MWSVIAMTSKCLVLPYRSMTSRTDRRPSLHRVCTWKSQSRNGSYPGTLGPHIEMLTVGRPVPQNLGPEVPYVERKHPPLPHRHVAPCGRPYPAPGRHPDTADRRETAPEVGVLTVKLDRAVEPPDACECVRPHREIAAIQDRADTECVMDEHVRRGRDQDVVEANQCAAAQIPVVEPIGPGHTNQMRRLEQLLLHPFEPAERRAAISVYVRQHLTAGDRARRLAGDDKAFNRLVDHPHTRDRARHARRVVSARVVDDQDFVGRTGLRQKG